MKKKYKTPQTEMVILVEKMSILDSSAPISEEEVESGLAPVMAPVDEPIDD